MSQQEVNTINNLSFDATVRVIQDLAHQNGIDPTQERILQQLMAYHSQTQQ